MSTQVGLWIDHRKATMVAVTEKGEETSEILSDVEKQLRRSGDSPLKGTYEALQVPADDSRRHVRENSILTMTRSLRIFAMPTRF